MQDAQESTDGFAPPDRRLWKAPPEELLRLVRGRIDDVAYLDIETTGTGMPPASHSTTITFYFRGHVLQEHDPAMKRLLVEKMEREAAVYCTFYGEVFDLPFLRREFGLPLEKPHLDLCFWLRRLGCKGGLKKVQKLFPEIPERLSLDLDGFDAVRLWRMHRRGVAGALETLLTYNAEDTVVLEPLLRLAHNLEASRFERHGGAAIEPLALLPLPGLSTRVHEPVYRMLRGGAPGSA